MAEGEKYYQLKITLRDCSPRIWRRVQVPGFVTLAELHRVIQASFRWTNSHLHSFRIYDQLYGEPDPEDATQEEKKPVPKAGTDKKEPRAEVVEAERRGAARVVEQVSQNSTRLKGIRSIPKAANGTVHITKRQLDEMLENEPERYERLTKNKPELVRFHLS